jgi:hypothetical protein
MAARERAGRKRGVAEGLRACSFRSPGDPVSLITGVRSRRRSSQRPRVACFRPARHPAGQSRPFEGEHPRRFAQHRFPPPRSDVRPSCTRRVHPATSPTSGAIPYRPIPLESSIYWKSPEFMFFSCSRQEALTARLPDHDVDVHPARSALDPPSRLLSEAAPTQLLRVAGRRVLVSWLPTNTSGSPRRTKSLISGISSV